MSDLFTEIKNEVTEFSKLSEKEQNAILYPHGKIVVYAGKRGDTSRPLYCFGLEKPLFGTEDSDATHN